MAKSKTLTDEQEKAIKDTIVDLHDLDKVYRLMPDATFNALQRDCLRRLVRRVAVDSAMQDLPIGKPGQLIIHTKG